jgi:hypothetical protein
LRRRLIYIIIVKNNFIFSTVGTLITLIILGTGCTMRPANNLASICGKEVQFETLSSCPYLEKDGGSEVVIKRGYYAKQENPENYYMVTNEYFCRFFTPGLCKKDIVDFEKDMIIAVFPACSCCCVEVTKVIETENTFEFFVYERQIDCPHKSESRPYHVIKIKRTNKEISFNLKRDM